MITSAFTRRRLPGGCVKVTQLVRKFVITVACGIPFLCLPSQAQAQSLPSPWVRTDVGPPAIAGSASYASGVFTVSGAGTDIWDSADQFSFVYRQMSGDGVLVARVASIQNTDPWAKAGIMIRESLAAGSKHAFAVVTPQNGTVFQRRKSTSGITVTTSTNSIGAPQWLRLERRGSTITASRSSNGTSWSIILVDTVSLATNVYVGLAVTSHKPSQASRVEFRDVSLTTSTTSPGPLPSGWTSRDLGLPSIQGSATYSNGVFSVRGAGTDIAGSADQFHYAYRQFTGDVEIVARVTSISNTHAGAKAGVMIRDALTANAAHAHMFVTASQGLSYQERRSAGGSTSQDSATSGAAPYWVRLQRRGSVVTGYYSSNGTSWTQAGTTTLSLPNMYVGLAVTSRNTGTTALGTFDNVRVTTPNANQPPTVSLTAPADGATFNAPANITLTASASDPDGTIGRVDFYQGSSMIASATAPPYSISWSGVSQGTYTIYAIATDSEGATTKSASRSVNVQGSNQLPTVSLTAPADNARYTPPASITISATASDTDGTIAGVDFFAGTTLIGSDSTSPYSFTWQNVQAGTYSITARARDNRGGTRTSAARTVVVAAATTTYRATFTASSNHSTAVTNYVFEVFAATANPSTAAPIATRDLGKPTPSSGQITVDVTTTIAGLARGNYIATVRANGPGGSARSSPPTAFTR